MGIFYFDESIHPRAGFVLGAFVWYKADPSELIREALTRAGLRPGIDEFKSGSRMDMNPNQAHAREELHEAVHGSRIGIVIAPIEQRHYFGVEALHGLAKILVANGLPPRDQEAFFDRGLVPNMAVFGEVAHRLGISECVLHPEQDSVLVLGLQVADLVAHTCSTMLLAQMGLVTKQIKAGPYSGYDPEADLDLSFMLWAGLRRNFFAADPPDPSTWESQFDFKVDVTSRGLYVSESCPPELCELALTRFGTMYVGCVH